MEDTAPQVLETQLEWGLTAMKTPLNTDVRQSLLTYLRLLNKWNQVYNLTAVRDPIQMVSTHLLDSLSVVPVLPPGDILDVGSGAGLPGIPLAVALPKRQFTLLESSEKRIAFLRQAIAELRLGNVSIIGAKVEDWCDAIKYQCIIARAYADMSKFIESTQHLLANDGLFAAMKGRYPAPEFDNLPQGFAIKEVIKLSVPGMDAARHLVLAGRT